MIFRSKEIFHIELVTIFQEEIGAKKAKKMEHNISNLFYWTRFLLDRGKTHYEYERQTNKMWIVNTIVIGLHKELNKRQKMIGVYGIDRYRNILFTACREKRKKKKL